MAIVTRNLSCTDAPRSTHAPTPSLTAMASGVYTLRIRPFQLTRRPREPSDPCRETSTPARHLLDPPHPLVIHFNAFYPRIPSLRCWLVILMPDPTPGIYLDYAATTPVEPEVAEAMAGFLTHEGTFGNPHSTAHRFGLAAHQAVEIARRDVARLICSDEDEIVLTSGATEAINLAVKGAMQSQRTNRRHLLVSSLEHKAVLDTADWLAGCSFQVDRVAPDKDGLITPSVVESHIRPDTAVVSLMHVNNEVGTITDIGAIAHVAHEHGALLHVDAAQSAARLPIDVRHLQVDLLSLSGHKIYGPKGVGALFARRATRSFIEAQTHGGGQEGGLRSGTLPTHQIVGLGVAARLVRERLPEDAERMATIDSRLLDWIRDLDGAEPNGNQLVRVPGILSVAFRDVEAESLMLALGDIAVSAGSACTTSQVEPSHVLLGLGLPVSTALSSIRLSPGRYTTPADIDAVGHRLHEAVAALRSIAA